MANIEELAAYRANPFAKAANMLTGGLLGAITGQNQRERDALLARRQLIEEAALERRMKMQRQIELAQQIQDEERARRIAEEERVAAAGRQEQEAIGGMMGVSGAPVDMGSASPYFRAGQVRAQFEQTKEEEKRAAEERRNLPLWRAAAEMAGLNLRPDATPAQIKAAASAAGAIIPQRTALQTRAKTARAFLRGIGQPVPENATDEEVLGAAQAAGFEKPSATMQRMEKEQENIDALFATTDPDELRRLFALLTPAQQRNEEVRKWAGILPDLPPTVRKELDALPKRWAQADRVLGALSALAGNKNIAEISQQNFNQLSRAVNSKKSALFGDDQTRRLVANVIQQFEGLVSGTRKDLFGASLTGNELESAKAMFGDKNSANFLERAMLFMDGLYLDNPASYYEGQYRGAEPYSKRFEEARSRYLQGRQNLKGVLPFAGTPSAPATGATNAPAGTPQKPQRVIRRNGQLMYE